MGYHVGYQRSVDGHKVIDSLDDTRWASLTHLAIGALLVNADGTLDTQFAIDPVSGPAFVDETVTAAHAHGVKAILMVGGAGAHDTLAAAASAARTTLVSALVTFGKAHAFDGLDIDWEPIADSEHATLFALLDDLRTAWPEALLTLPIATFNSNFESGNAYHVQLASRVDQLNLMSYEMAGTYEGWKSWHSSPLDGESSAYPTSIQHTVDSLLAAGVPKAKLGVGSGFYGLCYNGLISGPRQVLSGALIVSTDSTMSYDRIMTSYYSAAAAHYDDDAQVPYLAFNEVTGLLGCRYISYEDEQSIAAKGAFVKARGLGGTIIWTIAEGFRPSQPTGQQHPLLDAMRAAFR